VNKNNLVKTAWFLFASVLRVVSAADKNSYHLTNTTCAENITAHEFIGSALKLKSNWAEKCCSLSWEQRGVMREVQQAVVNRSIVNPNKVYLPFFNLTIMNYFNEYSVNWKVVKHALAAVFMVGKDNPFSSSSSDFKNETLQLARRWVLAWKNTTNETLPLLWLSAKAIEMGKAPFSCYRVNDSTCAITADRLNNLFSRFADIFISVLFSETEITTSGVRSWSSLNKGRMPGWSKNHSLFNAPWYCEAGAPQTGVIAHQDVIGEQVGVACVYPLNANTRQRQIDWGSPCASATRL
jgi:hypothetical protein